MKVHWAVPVMAGIFVLTIAVIMGFTPIPNDKLGIIFVNSYAQNQLFTDESIIKTNSEKISPILSQWQQAANPQVFAQNNNIQLNDGKIKVYIYLINSESISNLPIDIDVIKSSGQIVSANINSQQITNLAQLDFVHRIDLPITGTVNAQEPSVDDTPEPSVDDLKSDSKGDIYYLIIPAVLTIVAVIVFKKRNKQLVEH